LKYPEEEESKNKKKKEEGTSDRPSNLYNVQVNVETLQHPFLQGFAKLWDLVGIQSLFID
jgi:hypothetical protein